MDGDARIWQVQEFKAELWYARVHDADQSGDICEWVSSFHPERLRCQNADDYFHEGGYNCGFKVRFEDDTTWLIRFPQDWSVNEHYADEKVAIEVAVIDLIRRETTIPVPKVQAWGLAAQNPLGLGPFIIMDFMEDCVSLVNFLPMSNDSRLITEDISDDEMEFIYRQFADILLQLFKLDFDSIGSFESLTPRLNATKRPLTWKVHDILHTGGVDTFDDRNQGFSSSTEYFEYVFGQDLRQLDRQPSSISSKKDAMTKYRSFQVLKSLIPNFIHDGYDHGKFKILCDDLGLANLMVRSREDLTIVGVVDLEWSYIGPAQMFGSSPWWLLMDRPTNHLWSCRKGEPTQITSRYFRYLDMFKGILEEEEANTPGHENKELSKLIQWSQDSGAMWLHMLLMTGFNDPHSFPFTKLVQHVGIEEWERRAKEVDDDEVEAFADRKVEQLNRYKSSLVSVKRDAWLVSHDKMMMEEFIAKHSAPPNLDADEE